jgi:hypothetical protein
MANAGLQTLLLEAGGPSYGITGGDLNSRRPASISTLSSVLTDKYSVMAERIKSH